MDIKAFIIKYKEVAISSLLLVAALIVEFGISFEGDRYVYLSLYSLSYLLVGGPVWMKAFQSIRKGTIFSEFLLMGIATVGAFALGEYAEGVAVMLFYMIGEYVQHGAVYRARSSIKTLLDQQPDVAIVERKSWIERMHPSQVEIGEVIQVKPGGKVPLDGTLLDGYASFNTAALTGESKPMGRAAGEEVWAGSINTDAPVRIQVSRGYKDTKLARILELTQQAAQQKAPTQRFITKFAKVYTPVVVWLAVALTFLPALFVSSYVFQEWFYRALIFLVVSCPCGLVISIPLGYFGGIGAASQNGILFKGSNFLDQLRKMKVLFMDKTGTLTEGSFRIQQITSVDGIDEAELLQIAASLEQQSMHPIGKVILDHANGTPLKKVEAQKEISGKGLEGIVDGKKVLLGNQDLMEQNKIRLGNNGFGKALTQVYLAVDGRHVGTIGIADRLKEDSTEAIRDLKKQGLERLVMLSGDQQEVVDEVAATLGLEEAYGNLLPDEKYEKVKQALNSTATVGFLGDGVNDAPVITLADVGMAMGGIGSDATIETADVVIQTDQPSKIPMAIEIAHFTHRVVWQNIGFALGIKLAVMGLAALGVATLWEAIFADVGVALIAIANAVRVQQKFSDSKLLGMMGAPSDKQIEEESVPCCDAC